MGDCAPPLLALTVLMASRHYLTVACVARLLAAGLGAQTEPLPSNDDPLAVALKAEIAALSTISWISSTSLTTSVGWRDNVLLSTFAPVRRAFGRAEIEATLLRPPRRQWEFFTFLNGDLLRYLSPPSDTAGEQQWTLHSEVRWVPAKPVRVAVRAIGYWQDTVIDQSESEILRFVAPTRVCGGFVTVTPRFVPRVGWRVEPWVQLKRNDYRGYSGDFDEPKGGMRLEWQWTRTLSLSGAWSELHRRFDHRTSYTVGGRPLPDTRLRFRQREGSLTARATVGSDGAWLFATTASRLENSDQASGYFDYLQRRLAFEMEWRHSPWRAAAWLEGGRTDYRTQTVGAGIAPPARLSDDYETVLRVERTLNPRWSVYAEHHWERSRSNLPDFGYRDNTVRAGIRRDF